jgi:hypothetical protein
MCVYPKCVKSILVRLINYFLLFIQLINHLITISRNNNHFFFTDDHSFINHSFIYIEVAFFSFLSSYYYYNMSPFYFSSIFFYSLLLLSTNVILRLLIHIITITTIDDCLINTHTHAYTFVCVHTSKNLVGECIHPYGSVNIF